VSGLDENGLVDFVLEPDNRLTYSAGGQTGRLTLLNGQVILMPWKSQQEIANSVPGFIRTAELDSGGSHWQQFQVWSAELSGNSPGAIEVVTTYPNDTSDGGSRGQPYVHLSSGFLTGGTSAEIFVRGGASEGVIQMFGDVSFSDVISVEEIESLPATDLTITGQNDLTLRTTGTGSGTGDAILIDSVAGITISADDDILVTTSGAGDHITLSPVGDTNVFGANVVIQPSSTGDISLITTGAGGAIDLNAGAGGIDVDTTGNITVDGALVTLFSSSGAIDLNSGTSRAVRANDYLVMPLMEVGSSIVGGTPPTVGSASPGYRIQAGKATPTFTAGAGTLTFPTTFANGLLSVVVMGAGNDVVISQVVASTTKAAAALRCYIAGAAATGAVDLTYVAIGW
jgi:hypothetical protein